MVLLAYFQRADFYWSNHGKHLIFMTIIALKTGSNCVVEVVPCHRCAVELFIFTVRMQTLFYAGRALDTRYESNREKTLAFHFRNSIG